MAFGENVTRISLAATTAKKYSQKKRGLAVILLEFVDYFLINSVKL